MKRLLFYIIFVVSSVSTIHPKNLIWDLGGTLLHYDEKYLRGQISAWHYSMYTLFDGKNHEDMIDKAFDILGFIAGYQEGHEDILMRRDNGQPFPLVFVEWQEGKRTLEEIRREAFALLEELKADDEQSDSDREFLYFCSKGEYILVKNSLEILLDVQTLSCGMKPIPKAVSILEKCIVQTDEKGKPLHTLFILSNWDKESFPLLTKHERNKTLFALFNPLHMIISGIIGMVKPRHDAFHYMIKEFNLKPAECIFIDDQEENIKAARRCGMQTIHVKNQDFEYLEKELIRLKVIS